MNEEPTTRPKKAKKANAKRVPGHHSVIKLGVFITIVFGSLLAALLTYGIKDRLSRRHTIAASKYTAEAERALMEYFVDHQSFPEGDNAAITLALTGENDSRKDYFTRKSRDTNTGVMRDAYETPLRIRYSGSNVIVESAGEDRVFDTWDDIGSAAYKAIAPYPPLPRPATP